MKKVLFLLVSVMALAGCTGCKVDISNWGDGDILEASNNIVTKSYKLAPFEEVVMRCVGDLVLTQDESKDGTVELTAPDNYIELYRFKSDGKKLDIDFKKNHINIHTAQVKIHVFTTDLTKFRNTGAGTITINNLDTDRLDVENAGVGSITCFASESIDGQVTGVGSLKYAGHPKQKKLNKQLTGGITEI